MQSIHTTATIYRYTTIISFSKKGSKRRSVYTMGADGKVEYDLFPPKDVFGKSVGDIDPF
ncbi:MAG: hypothetical protein ACI8RD_014042, partial [Bacillariaceae sp.]